MMNAVFICFFLTSVTGEATFYVRHPKGPSTMYQAPLAYPHLHRNHRKAPIVIGNKSTGNGLGASQILQVEMKVNEDGSSTTAAPSKSLDAEEETPAVAGFVNWKKRTLEPKGITSIKSKIHKDIAHYFPYLYSTKKNAPLISSPEEPATRASTQPCANATTVPTLTTRLYKKENDVTESKIENSLEQPPLSDEIADSSDANFVTSPMEDLTIHSVSPGWSSAPSQSTTRWPPSVTEKSKVKNRSTTRRSPPTSIFTRPSNPTSSTTVSTTDATTRQDDVTATSDAWLQAIPSDDFFSTRESFTEFSGSFWTDNFLASTTQQTDWPSSSTKDPDGTLAGVQTGRDSFGPFVYQNGAYVRATQFPPNDRFLSRFAATPHRPQQPSKSTVLDDCRKKLFSVLFGSSRDRWPRLDSSGRSTECDITIDRKLLDKLPYFTTQRSDGFEPPKPSSTTSAPPLWPGNDLLVSSFTIPRVTSTIRPLRQIQQPTTGTSSPSTKPNDRFSDARPFPPRTTHATRTVPPFRGVLPTADSRFQKSRNEARISTPLEKYRSRSAVDSSRVTDPAEVREEKDSNWGSETPPYPPAWPTPFHIFGRTLCGVGLQLGCPVLHALADSVMMSPGKRGK